LPSTRNFAVCASWQSMQVTPRWCILVCSQEFQTNTSSSCWPSAWKVGEVNKARRWVSSSGAPGAPCSTRAERRAWQAAQLFMTAASAGLSRCA
jgi:hypothetical protein